MFRTVPLSIIRSFFLLYKQQWYMSYRFADSLLLARKLSANLYDIYHCCMYSKKTPDDGKRNCPKHAEFHSKNKFEKLVHLVGFIIRIVVMKILRGKTAFHYTTLSCAQTEPVRCHLCCPQNVHSLRRERGRVTLCV